MNKKIGWAISLCFIAACTAGWGIALVDESFEGYTTGELNGQGGWSFGYVTHVAYEGDVTPPRTAPGSWDGWIVEEGKMPPNSSLAWSSSGGVLEIDDDGTVSGDDKIKWSKSVPELNNSIGTTVTARIRCNFDTVGENIDYHGNVFVYDGQYQSQLMVLRDRVRVANIVGTNQHLLNGTQWHTYTMTIKGSSLNVYLDGDATPIISGTLSGWYPERKVLFGAGNSTGQQHVFIDYVRWRTDGAFAPGTTPEVISAPVRTGSQAAGWMCGTGSGGMLIDKSFPARWNSGIVELYFSVRFDATDGPGAFSHLRFRDEDGDEGPRVTFSRGPGQTGSISVYDSTFPGSLKTVLANPANNVWYNIKLVCDIDGKTYDAYHGDGDRTGAPGHWTQAQSNMKFVSLACDGFASMVWQMNQLGAGFNGPAYVYLDDLYFEGPDVASGGRATEIWIAKGTYTEKITLPQDAHIVGGFAGTELSKAERNGESNQTIVNAGDSSVGSSAITGSFLSSVEGLTVTGGYYGVNATGGSMYVLNNVIKGNAQAGVYSGSGAPNIINNTVVQNNYGLALSNSSAKVRNNIVALNATGVVGGGGTPLLAHNNVYGNTGADYSGIAPGPDDLSKDPMFVDASAGNFRLLFGSPCIDAADQIYIPYYDRDGKRRPVDGDGDGTPKVDIGAYESQFVPELQNIADLPDAADDSILRIEEAVVTAAWPGVFYVQSDNRASGIRIDKPNHELTRNMRANVSGRIKTDSQGERYLEAVAAVQEGTGSADPVAMNILTLGGAAIGLQQPVGEGVGLNNVGLLVRVSGTIRQIDSAYPATWFTLDDGSRNPVKIALPPGVSVNSSWEYVSVTGVSSCERVGDEVHPMIRVRNQQDIVVLK